MDKEDRRRIKQLLTDAVLVLCKASLRYRRKFTIEGLLGVTLDGDEVHLININELVEKDIEETRTNGKSNLTYFVSYLLYYGFHETCHSVT